MKHLWWAVSCSFVNLYTIYRSWGQSRFTSFKDAARCAYAARKIKPEDYK